MRKLKKVLVVIMIAVLLFAITKTEAYDGMVDTSSEVTISQTLQNGNGEVTLTRNIQTYQMYYQYLEIDSNTYNQIRKLKDELLVAQYYNIWEADQTDENYDIYVSAYLFYQDKYNETVDDYTQNRIDEVESIIIGLLPDYTENWILTSNNKINVDLSQFSGTKDYIVWVKIETGDRVIYDAEVYELQGTKVENNDPNPTPDPEPDPDPGISVDLEDEIELPERLVNGEGTVTVTRNIEEYDMYYQNIEISEELYKQIRKLKDELLVAQYYNIWEADQTDENYDIYVSAYLFYKDKYNETVDDYTERRIDEVESIIIGLLPEYTDNWTLTSDNKIKIDLSQFSGTKYYAVWVKVDDGKRLIYEADVYEVTGTKIDDNKPGDDDNKPGDDDNNKPGDDDNKPGDDDNKPGDDDNNKPGDDDNNKPGDDDNKPGDDDNKPGDDDNKPGDDDNNKPGDDDNKPGDDDNNKPGDDDNKKPVDNNKVDNDSKNNTTTITKGDTTTSNKKMPYTGTTSTILQFSIIGAIIMAIVTFIKMKKIK